MRRASSAGVDCRKDFTPIDARVLLHRQIDLAFREVAAPNFIMTALSYTYSDGQIWTLPAAYLCPQHAWILPEPIRMTWPVSEHSW